MKFVNDSLSAPFIHVALGMGLPTPSRGVRLGCASSSGLEEWVVAAVLVGGSAEVSRTLGEDGALQPWVDWESDGELGQPVQRRGAPNTVSWKGTSWTEDAPVTYLFSGTPTAIETPESQVAGVSLPGKIPEREVSSAGSPATSCLTIFGIQEVRDVHAGDAFVFLREARELVGDSGRRCWD